MLLVDALSRLPSPTNHTIELDMRIEHHGFTTQRLQQIATETEEDPVLAAVYNLTLDRWPNRKSMVPQRVHRYWDQRDEQQHRPWNPTEKTLHSHS